MPISEGASFLSLKVVIGSREPSLKGRSRNALRDTYHAAVCLHTTEDRRKGRKWIDIVRSWSALYDTYNAAVCLHTSKDRIKGSEWVGIDTLAVWSVCTVKAEDET